MVEWIILSLTAAERCSYVEMVAKPSVTEQKPTWFVSYTVLDSIATKFGLILS